MISSTPLALWHAFGPIVMMTSASILVLDANWMVACLRRGAQAPPPVFKAPIAIEGKWRKVAYLLLAIFCIAPMMLVNVTGVWRLLGWFTTVTMVAGMIVTLTILFIAERRRWHVVGNIAGLAAVIVPIVPYALTGSTGRLHYLVIVGLLIFILLLMCLAVNIHRALLGHRPRSKLMIWLRLLTTGTAAAVLATIPIWHVMSE